MKMLKIILTFKEKSLILEEPSKPNFDKEKTYKDFIITESGIYRILKEKSQLYSRMKAKL